MDTQERRTPPPMRALPLPLLECAASRFWSKVEKIEGGCWEWRAFCYRGYGRFWFRGEFVRAHRVSYTLVNGELPDGLTIDHLCRNKKCVNPAHLEAVTSKENTLRGISFSAVNRRKERCVRGHAFDQENTYMRIGKRHCRTCRRDELRQRRRQAKITQALKMMGGK